MEKYSKILIYIFLFSVINSVLITVLFFKLNRNESAQKNESEVVIPSPISKTSATPQPSSANLQPDIKSDLNLIKAELRALRESIDSTGIATTTPNP